MLTIDLLQGVPVGLAFGSIPFLLKSHLSYGQVGVFSLASYPYSMKLLWSPIVDAIYSRKLGRRKSWIVPIQACSGLLLLWLGGHIEALMIRVNNLQSELIIGGNKYYFHYFHFLFLGVPMCHTRCSSGWFLPPQPSLTIGWALTLLSVDNLSYASTAQTIGLNTGYFLSFTVFLAFASPEFANKYFRSVPSDEGLVTLGGYLKFWGWMYLLVTVWLAKFKKEEKTRTDDGGVLQVYQTIWSIIKLPRIYHSPHD
jgi:MFS transporter, PAT family, solute carrier family 33 (acetyl-CoA transportor), member 1